MLERDGKAILRTPGGELRLVAPADAARAQSELGWSEASDEDVRIATAQKEQGGALGMAKTVGEEAVRTAVGVASLLPGVDAGRAPVGLTELEPGQQGNALSNVYSDPALARREVNPVSAAVGSQLGVLPAYLAGGVPGMVAGDVLLGMGQEATDAEIERRGISGANMLRNGALNLVFSGAAAAMPAAARALMTGSENIIKRGAKRAAALLDQQGAKAVEKRAETLFKGADEALDAAKAPKVANNPKSQREALETLVQAFEKSDPKAARRLSGVLGAAPETRYNTLREMAEGAEGELGDALRAQLGREELWGPRVKFARDIEAARSLRPPEGAPLEAWRAYGEALRQIPGERFAKLADQLDGFSAARAVESWGAKTTRAAAGKVAGFAAGTLAEEATETAFKGAGTVIGAALTGGNPLGAAGGWFLGRHMAKQYGEKVAARLAQSAEKVASGQSKSVVDVADFLKRYAESDRALTARLLTDPKGASRYLRIAEAPLTPLDRFRGEHTSLSQAFAESRRQVEEFERNPVAMLDLLSEQFGDVDEMSPLLHRQMTEQAIKVQKFLRSRLPPRRGVSVARPEGSPPSPLEMRQYAIYHTAALDPESVYADARAGKLRKEQVETLQELWPEEYDDLRNLVVAELGNGRSTPATRQRLSLLFDLDGTIDPALGSRVRRIVADAQKRSGNKQNQSSPGMTRAEPPSKMAMTPGGMQSVQLGMTMGAP